MLLTNYFTPHGEIVRKNEKEKFKKYIQENFGSHELGMLKQTNSEYGQIKAYEIIKKFLERAGISFGASVIDKNMNAAVTIIKNIKSMGLVNLQIRKPLVQGEVAPVLDIDGIAFSNPQNSPAEGGERTFTGRLTQGKNDKQVTYTVSRCDIGIVVICKPIVNPNYMRFVNKVDKEGQIRKKLNEFSVDSLKHLNVGNSSEKTRYKAAARMEIQYTRPGVNGTASFFVVSCGQNTDMELKNVGNEYHGEAFIYGAFLATLRMLNLSVLTNVKVIIDYSASTKQVLACAICKKLVRDKIWPEIRAVEGVNSLVDNYAV